jgi:hypothetical protein
VDGNHITQDTVTLLKCSTNSHYVFALSYRCSGGLSLSNSDAARVSSHGQTAG